MMTSGYAAAALNMKWFPYLEVLGSSRTLSQSGWNILWNLVLAHKRSATTLRQYLRSFTT